MIAAILAAVRAVLGALPLIGAWLLGRAQRDRAHAEDNLDRVDKARTAVDRVRSDRDERERLRDAARGDG